MVATIIIITYNFTIIETRLACYPTLGSLPAPYNSQTYYGNENVAKQKI